MTVALGQVAPVRMNHVACGTVTGWHPRIHAMIVDGRRASGFCSECVQFFPLAGFERVDN